MHFLYFLVLCFASTVPIPVHTTIIITGNLKDFRSLFKTLSINSANHIKESIQENDSKYNEETSEDVEHTAKTIENIEDRQQYQQYDSREVITEFLNDIVQKPLSRYRIENAPKVVPLRTPPVLDIDDIVEQVKQKLLQEILAKSGDARKLNAEANTLVRNAQEEQTQILSPIVDKYVANNSSENTVENRQQTPVPMKVVKEEIQFEATYEEAQDKDVELQKQNIGQIRNPEQGKPPENETKKVLPNKNKTVKKVRFVKQVVVPANLNQEQPANVLQPSMKPMQQLNDPQISMVAQPNLARQLTLMQHQIELINKTALQKLSKTKDINRQTDEEEPQIDTEEANTESGKIEDEQSINSNEDNAELSKEETEEDEREKESANLPVDNTSSKEQTEATATVEEGQLTEDNEAQEPTGTVEDEASKETTPEEKPQSVSNEEDNKADNAARLDGALRSKVEKEELHIKVPTKNFGSIEVEQLGQKSDRLNEPVLTNLTWDNPPTGSRKVMLF